ncbi:hypothetical protein LZ578_03375 [Jeotgalibaca sp. MA1X17-3]|uniref:hypothetical protein n=1 Tax=Jeotgalibaca sp. MA1X17-3 TaxID=2908211 RepID=UPI001F24BF12|nr:hypothetical protein [Jeotgalibaca sp. MA1X17-3]UJF16186.1 hypothetical protein LZ578_03375 [Jeotgalibaca sp. MA1X17-3]
MFSIKEKENMVQTTFLIILVMLKRYAGILLGEFENVIFIFSAVIVFYFIHFLFVTFGKNYPEKDDWEERLNLFTIGLYGIGVFILQMLQVTNLTIMAMVGILLIGINVLIKSKRRAAKESIEKNKKKS